MHGRNFWKAFWLAPHTASRVAPSDPRLRAATVGGFTFEGSDPPYRGAGWQNRHNHDPLAANGQESIDPYILWSQLAGQPRNGLRYVEQRVRAFVRYDTNIPLKKSNLILVRRRHTVQCVERSRKTRALNGRVRFFLPFPCNTCCTSVTPRPVHLVDHHPGRPWIEVVQAQSPRHALEPLEALHDGARASVVEAHLPRRNPCAEGFEVNAA